jgi:hypothetical protein
MFVFSGKSRESAALVRRYSPIFVPTVAKTVAIGLAFVDDHVDPYPIVIAPRYMCVPLYKEVVHESTERPRHTHGAPTRFKEMATELGKDVAEALRDIVVMVAGEAAKRAIWG